MNVKSKTLADSLRTYKINEYITVKLEQNQTNIYVKDKLFRQCKYILLNIPVDETSKFDEIQSIDEAVQILDHSQEPQYDGFIRQITPKEEFWAHASNLQAWAENNYDSRLIHSNLAFPLLKELISVGDPKAKKVFKEEIARRLDSGSPSTISFIREEGFLDFLTHEEQLYSLLESAEAEALLNIEHKSGVEFEMLEQKNLEYYSPKSHCYIGFSNKHVITIELGYVNFDSIITDLLKFSTLKSISLADERMVYLPSEMRDLDSIAEIGVTAPKLEKIPDWLLDLKDLRLISISSGSLKKGTPNYLTIIKKMKEKGVYIDIP